MGKLSGQAGRMEGDLPGVRLTSARARSGKPLRHNIFLTSLDHPIRVITQPTTSRQAPVEMADAIRRQGASSSEGVFHVRGRRANLGPSFGTAIVGTCGSRRVGREDHTMNDYPSIADHGLIGDLQTTALVATDGTIDWFCSPRFDSPSIFAALLDNAKGGHFSAHPHADAFETSCRWPPKHRAATIASCGRCAACGGR